MSQLLSVTICLLHTNTGCLLHRVIVPLLHKRGSGLASRCQNRLVALCDVRELQSVTNCLTASEQQSVTKSCCTTSQPAYCTA